MNARSFGSVLALGFLLSSAAILGGCSPGESSEVAQEQLVSVRVAPVTSEAEAESLRFAGTVQPRQKAVLTFQVNGTLRERPVTLGQAVVEGEVLARVYNPQLEPARDSAKAKLRELQAQAKQSARELERAEKLHKKGVQSIQLVEQVRASHEALEAGVATAKAMLAQAERMVAETELRAPFDGRIESLLVEPGEFINPGQPVMGLAAAHAMEVEIKVPEHLLANLQPGDKLPVWQVRERDAGEIPGRIAEIAQSNGDPGKLQTLVVHLQDPPSESPLIRNQLSQQSEEPAALRMSAVPVAGSPVEVGIPVRAESSLSVPMLAVMRSRDGAAVFRVQGGRAERVPVDVVQLLGEEVLVRSQHLQAEDSVVFAGLTRLADGDAVEVLP